MLTGLVRDTHVRKTPKGLERERQERRQQTAPVYPINGRFPTRLAGHPVNRIRDASPAADYSTGVQVRNANPRKRARGSG